MSTANLNLVDARLMHAPAPTTVAGAARMRTFIVETAQVLRSVLLPVSGSLRDLDLGTRHGCGAD